MSLCIVCHVAPAEVPDRERMGKPVKRLCRMCHADRLLADLRKIRDGEIRDQIGRDMKATADKPTEGA